MPGFTSGLIVRWLRILIVSVAFGLCSSSSALAQAPAPYTLSFTASANHSAMEHTQPVVAGYQLVLRPEGGSDLPAIELGKPAPDATNVVTVDVSSQLQALPAGTYVAKVKAVGPGGEAVSADSAPFSLTISAPAVPGAPAITR